MKSLSPISCSLSPSHLKFLSSSQIIAASESGSIQICNTIKSKELDYFNNISVNGYVTHMDVSSAGSVAIGDSFGGIALWIGGQGVVNSFSRETAYIDLEPPALPFMNEDSYLSLITAHYHVSECLIIPIPYSPFGHQILHSL
jgi:hypothetical protein